MDKEEGISSFAAVRRVRRVLGGVRAGHAGSLDPMATGLLPVVVGRATRLARFVASGTKRYLASVRFGQATDTDDRTGKQIGAPAPVPSEAALREALGEFLGVIEQRPPPYSAKRVRGQRAYRLARAGRPAWLAPARIRVDSLELLGFEGAVAEIACQVGPGAYIRALARDLGERLGGAAHLVALRRTGVGRFRVGDATRSDDLGDREAVLGRLLDPLVALGDLPRLPVSPEGALALAHGRALPVEAAAGAGAPAAPPGSAAAGYRCAVTSDGETLVAVVTRTDAGWRPLVGWAPPQRLAARSGSG